MSVSQTEALDSGGIGDGQASPGRRLREARLLARISVEDVAARLRLEPRIVEALERDSYADLHGGTFVRGYLRGYARLLNLPENPLIEAYNRLDPGHQELTLDLASKPQAKSTDISVRLVTYLVAAALVTLVILWWRGETSRPGDTPGPASPVPGASVTEPLVPPQQLPLAAPVELQQLVPPPAPAKRVEPTPEPPAGTVAAPGATPVPEPSTPARAPRPDVPAVAERPAPAAPAAGVAPVPATDPGPAFTEVPPAATVKELDRLVLRFAHDSWVEVMDRDGKRLFRNLAKAGQTLDISGQGPMRVTLGYARGARVEYNDERFDYGPFTQGDVARFTLGQ